MKIGYYKNKSIKNNVCYFLEQKAHNKPNKIAFYYSSNNETRELKYKKITYQKINDKAATLASGLNKKGVFENDRMLILLPISVELYIIIAALQRINAIPVFIESIESINYLQSIIKNCSPKGIFSTHETLIKLDNLFESFKIYLKISTDTKVQNNNKILFLNELLNSNKIPIKPVYGNSTALITYTTGSTGIPKGANRTHKFLASQHYVLHKLFPYKNKDIDLPVFPVFTLNNIASGITTVIPKAIDQLNIYSPKKIIEQIKKFNVTNMTLSPSSFKTLATYCINNKISLKNITRVLTGGAPISEDDIKKFQFFLPNSKNYILYGSTEVEPISFIEAGKMIKIKPSTKINTTQVGVNVGKIDKNLKYKLIKINFKNNSSSTIIKKIELKKGLIGEIIVSGKHVCNDYYNNKIAFKQTKIIDQSGIIWHRTGDLGRIDNSGYLWIVGRINNIVKYKNTYYFPVRPEILLKNMPDVTNAAYLNLQKNNQNYILSVITISNNKNINKIKQKIILIFNKNKIPLDKIIITDDIPMDLRHHSKVNYQKLRDKLYELL